VHVVAELVSYLFPVSEAMLQHTETFKQLLGQSPHPWFTLLVLALTPAVCEELAFRGFILSGLRHMGHKWGAIVLSAVLLMATLTGVVLGFIAVQTGSLLPCIIYHFVHNSSAVLSTAVDEHLLQAWPVLEWVFVPVKDGYAFAWWVAVVGGMLAAMLLWWMARLPHAATREEELQKALDHQTAAAA
jgi:sodium transport system permease protein